MSARSSSKRISSASNRPNNSSPVSSNKTDDKSMSNTLFNKPSRLYNKKIQHHITLTKIRQSAFINDMRMKIAKTKFQLCQQIFNEVLKRLTHIASSQAEDYQLILISLIVEGCIQMFEEDIKIKVLGRDVGMVRDLLPDVNESFQHFMEEEMGHTFPINLIVLENDTLKERECFQKQLNKNEESELAIGGVILTDLTGNIVFKNTLDARLGILKESAFPLITEVLWGGESQRAVQNN